MPEMNIPQNDILSEICAFCGFALYPLEVAGEFTGAFIDYDLRVTGNGGFVLCGECMKRVRYAMIADMDDAVDRRVRSGVDDK